MSGAWKNQSDIFDCEEGLQVVRLGVPMRYSMYYRYGGEVNVQ